MINNTEEENPSFTVRNRIVGKHLSMSGHQVFYNSKSISVDYDDYDVFIFNRFYRGLVAEHIRFLKENGKTIIYETDDNYEGIDESHAFVKIRKEAVKSSRELIKLADGITVSTTELKREILKKNPSADIHVITNALDFTEYPKRKNKNKKVKVGFQGSNIHVQDLLIVIDAIQQLQEEIEFDFEIFGIDDRPFKELNKFCLEYKKRKWQWIKDFPKLYEKLEEINYRHIPFCEYTEYRKKLATLDWDIGIAPLTDTLFNRAKSCLKFYEYAAVGTTTLASNVLPYNEEMEKEDLVKNRHTKWKNKLRRLILDKKYREERLKKQEQFLINNKNIVDVIKQWESAITSIYKKNEETNIGKSSRC
ncbi:MAG: hypothetical protein ACTSUW_03795 [Candidatus Heimdallarchaeota archaeon]